MNQRQFNQALQAIAGDREQGASQLARRCLRLVADSARRAPARDSRQLLDLLAERGRRLAGSRPSMAPVQNLLARFQAALDRCPQRDIQGLRDWAAEQAEGLEAESRWAVQTLAGHAAELLGDDRTLITHSLSSTVVAVCQRLKDRGLRVVASESRPRNEGRQLARQLSRWGVPTTLITDAQLGLFAARADLALVGADSVLADGAVVNKSGTYLLALAARDRGIPFYACCETFKFRRGTEPPALEEMDPGELGCESLPQVQPRNVYFEITPARLVDAWISEQGVLREWQA